MGQLILMNLIYGIEKNSRVIMKSEADVKDCVKFYMKT